MIAKPEHGESTRDFSHTYTPPRRPRSAPAIEPFHAPRDIPICSLTYCSEAITLSHQPISGDATADAYQCDFRNTRPPLSGQPHARLLECHRIDKEGR
jgi:hypothetical protein